jgi:hypothetical protein
MGRSGQENEIQNKKFAGKLTAPTGAALPDVRN